MEKSILEEVGLTEAEATIYLALLELGSNTAGSIIKKTGFHRATTYAIIQRLIEKGLVSSVIKGTKRFFEAADPDILLSSLQEKEERLRSLLPELRARKKQSQVKEQVNVYEGFQGIKAVREKTFRMMKKGETVYVLGASTLTTEKFNDYWQSYHRRRVKAGIRSKMLWTEEARRFGEQRKALGLTDVKYIPEILSTPVSIDIFKDITTIDITSERPFVIEIKSQLVADLFLKYFNLLWNQPAKVYLGKEGPIHVLQDMIETGKPIVSIGLNEDQLQKHVPKELDTFIQEIEKRKIRERLLFREGSETVLSKYSEVKFLPKEYFSPVSYEIYGDKVAMIDWTGQITTIILENKDITGSFRNYFNLLWRLSKSIKTKA